MIRYEDLYDQYRPSDGDRPFEFVEGTLFDAIRHGIPGEDTYRDTVEDPASVVRYHETFQHLIVDSLEELGIALRDRDPGCKEKRGFEEIEVSSLRKFVDSRPRRRHVKLQIPNTEK